MFDSVRKRMTTAHKIGRTTYSFVKGAPDVVLKLCDKIIVNGNIGDHSLLFVPDVLKTKLFC